MDIFEHYVPTSRYLVCIDSDGCVMDTMDVKHLQCFGPLWIEIFGLQAQQPEAMQLWLTLNLYARTRGINRFQGLAKASRAMVERGAQIPDLQALETWVAQTSELSTAALTAYCLEHPSPCLQRAILWSERVNKAIAALPQQDEPFPLARESLAQLCRQADLAGVSSANSGAVNAEWARHNLQKYTRLLCCQECGTKAEIIKQLLQRGYRREYVLMVGDAEGDRKAAEQNGVHFFPILVGKERESWQRLTQVYFPLLISGQFTPEIQAALNEEMNQILK